MTTYQKFQNPPSFGDHVPSTPEPPAYPTAPPAIQTAAMPINGGAPVRGPFVQQQQPAKKELKSLPTLRRLVRVEFVLSLAMILFEAIVDGVLSSSSAGYHPGVMACSMGTGIWVGILGAVAAGLGWSAFRRSTGNRCMIVAHFVMCIICAVADGIMIVFGGICLSMLPWYMRNVEYYHGARSQYSRDDADVQKRVAHAVATGRGMMATESFLLVAAVTHFIISIISTAFICRNWCQDSQPTVAVVYLPAGATGGNQQQQQGGGAPQLDDPSCRFAVPSGAHVQQYVIFVPMGNGSNGQTAYPPPQPEFRSVQEEEKRA